MFILVKCSKFTKLKILMSEDQIREFLTYLVKYIRHIYFTARFMSRDVPICNKLAICREVLNASSREVLDITGCLVLGL